MFAKSECSVKAPPHLDHLHKQKVSTTAMTVLSVSLQPIMQNRMRNMTTIHYPAHRFATAMASAPEKVIRPAYHIGRHPTYSM